MSLLATPNPGSDQPELPKQRRCFISGMFSVHPELMLIKNNYEIPMSSFSIRQRLMSTNPCCKRTHHELIFRLSGRSSLLFV